MNFIKFKVAAVNKAEFFEFYKIHNTSTSITTSFDFCFFILFFLVNNRIKNNIKITGKAMIKIVPNAKNKSARSKNADIKISDGTENKVRKFKKLRISFLFGLQV